MTTFDILFYSFCGLVLVFFAFCIAFDKDIAEGDEDEKVSRHYHGEDLK